MGRNVIEFTSFTVKSSTLKYVHLKKYNKLGLGVHCYNPSILGE